VFKYELLVATKTQDCIMQAFDLKKKKTRDSSHDVTINKSKCHGLINLPRNMFEYGSEYTTAPSFHIPYNSSRTFFFKLCGGTLGTAATTGLLYQPRMIGHGDCGEIGGMKIGRGLLGWGVSPTHTHTHTNT
jgi:hypothetical protein